MIARYEALKKERGFLDFNDFITRTDALLARERHRPWVHYKLDQGIDHILLDEAQDTSPDQWTIVMLAGRGVLRRRSARMINRTIFAVGDEKQSIYSFQGARPERFREESRARHGRAEAASETLRAAQLHVSFRSTEDVLTRRRPGVFRRGQCARA